MPDAAVDRANPCDSVEHTEEGYSTAPDYDDFWLQRDYRKDAGRFTVPALVAHGWQDFNVKQEEGTGLYDAIKGRPAWTSLYLTQGAHGSPSGETWETLLDAFFDRFLLGRGDVAPAVYSTPRDSAGRARAGEAASWPPPRTGDLELALGRAGRRRDAGPRGRRPGRLHRLRHDDRGGRGRRPGQRVHLARLPLRPGDQRRPHRRLRPRWTSRSPVDRDHGHFVPTLFDEAPDGTLTPITRGFLNLAYRDSWAKGVPMPTGKATRAVVSLLPQDWIVRKDHRLVVEVASSNVAWAVPDQAGLGVTVQHGGASRLLLPLVGFGTDPVTSLPAVPGGRRPREPAPEPPRGAPGAARQADAARPPPPARRHPRAQGRPASPSSCCGAASASPAAPRRPHRARER